MVGNFDPPILGKPVTAPFSNLDQPYDVNEDGIVAAQDALIVINDINRFGARKLETAGENQKMIDVNQDGYVSAMDVIKIINYINRQNRPLAAVPQFCPNAC